jgi:phenylacetic acid degradation operon negative regulatory protein
MQKLKTVETLLEDFRLRRPIRGGSLIITVFGDSISQHGNSVWLGSLITALKPFGINSRLVRTAVYRNSQDGWLTSVPSGRRSYYSFSDYGLRHYEKAARRIYVENPCNWDGHWTLVLTGSVADSVRETLRRELQWLGFGNLGAGLMACPSANRQSLDETLNDLQLTDRVAVMRATTDEIKSDRILNDMVKDCWELDQLAERYHQFLNAFQPVFKAASRAKSVPPEDAFQIRTLLIHEYRRILLKDTDLPPQVLPSNWPGRAASSLTAKLYRLTHESAMIFLRSNMQTTQGLLPKASLSYYCRFGGLQD